MDFSVLARQCLNRRIPTQTQLETEVLAWAASRNQGGVKIKWPFTADQAGETLNTQYVKVNPANIEYQKT